MKIKPMGILLTMLAGYINRQQQEVIEYLKAENEAFLEFTLYRKHHTRLPQLP